MAKILWHGGVEPPDAKAITGEGKTVAAYTGMIEENTVKAEEMDEPKPEQPTSSYDLGEMIARASAKLAEQTRERGRPTGRQPAQTQQGKKAVHNEKQQSQVTPTPIKGVAARQVSASGAGIYKLAHKRILMDDEPITIVVGDNQRMPVMMSLVSTESVAPKLAVELEVEEPPRKAEVIPIRFPLTDEQRKAEEFYQATGIKPMDIKAMFEPGWTMAEMLSPRANARRVRLGICNRWYDAEVAILKAKHAVHDFFYKKRPLPGKT